eukprot:gene4490-18750_t
MFEYAHLALFFMGITYGVFIQLAFFHRHRVCLRMKEMQTKTLA